MTRHRVVIEAELLAARRSRVNAVTALDFDAYEHLTEQILDLEQELPPQLPGQRTDEP